MDTEKRLSLMRFWLFGTFIIVFAAVLIYVGGALGLGLAIVKHLNFWIAVIVGAVLSVAWYYLYKWYITR